jgi:hypothetical protein
MKKEINNLVDNFEGIEVVLIDKFAVVKETLERMGIKNEKKKTFYPSCYILKDEQDPDKYRIFHFKQLFAKDGQESTYNLIDEIRLKTIVWKLDEWGLISTVNDIDRILNKKIDILPFSQKSKYDIIHKYMFIKNIKSA